MTNLEAYKSWSARRPTTWFFFFSFINTLQQGLAFDIRLMTDEVYFTCFLNFS